MTRIKPIDVDQAEGKTAELVGAVKAKMGGVPNLLSTMAQSPATLGGYLAFGEALGDASLSAAFREQIALAVAGANNCNYCAAAHTVLGKMQKVDEDELGRNLVGESSDERTQAGLAFARVIVEKRGWVSDDDLAAVRSAGFRDGEVTEILATTVYNTFTNYFNHLAGTEIDFPKVEIPEVATV